MTRWWERALSLIADREPTVLVTICATMGSSPRETGTKMLVWAGGQHGTIGGGNLEFMATDQARKMLAHVDSVYRIQDYPLGPLLAQCCGGHVRMLLERVDESSRNWIEELRNAERGNRPVALVTEVGEGELRKRVVIDESLPGTAKNEAKGGRDARAPRITIFDTRGHHLVGTRPVHDEKLTIIEEIQPIHHDLVMFGAGHVGQAVAPIVATLPFRVTWLDSRRELEGTGHNAVRVQRADDPVASVGEMTAGALYLVFTHSHDLDYKLVRAILERGDFRYCGLIGSATKRARFESRLSRDGIPSLDIARLTCPIGSIGLTAKAPEILAVGIAAELLLTIQNQSVALKRRREVRAPATHDH